ncbi:MAG: Mur ligase domain-containing protein [Candidatus Eisenbacteria bacterium]
MGTPPFSEPKDTWLHFVGVGGSGMSALAQYHAARGGRVTGSDRAFDRDLHADIRGYLERAGVEIVRQDGGRLDTGCRGVVVSTAVEDSVPDVKRARELGLPLIHRAELLARYVAERETVAITGTSGKSTVTGMVFEILQHAGLEPSVLTGGDLVFLREHGQLGNAWAGRGSVLVIEADESDGSLVHYEPWLGVLMNLQRDHKEPEELAEIFHSFRRRTRGPFVVGEFENLDPFADDSLRYGVGRRKGQWLDILATNIDCGPRGSRFEVDGVPFEIPVPGLHNVENALAAIAAIRGLDLPLETAAAGLSRFRGIVRRFQTIGTPRGIEVVDDFGHNPAKIAATLRAARRRGGRVLAAFQPHGFRPTAFIREELVTMLGEELRPEDRLWILDIFYAGGTAERTITSEAIVAEAAALGAPVFHAPDREGLTETIAAEAQPGDIVVVMGARDPSLTTFARSIVQAIESR